MDPVVDQPRPEPKPEDIFTEEFLAPAEQRKLVARE